MSEKDSEIQSQKPDYMKIRQEHGQLSEQLIQGPRYSEPVRVLCTDGKEHDVFVFALSTEEVQSLFKEAGVDLNDIGKPEKLLENMAFMTIAARHATKDPKIGQVLLGLEPSKIAMKMLELSGLTGAPKAFSTAT